MEQQLVEAWQIHDRINHYLLASLGPGGLEATASSRGRSVAEQFAHLHNVRLMWLEAAAPELVAGLAKIQRGAKLDQELLGGALAASARAIEALLRQSVATGGKIKGFRPHGVAFIAYLISHESHHRGQIALALKQSGQPLDRATAYGLWEWGAR